ncbi:MAG: AMP-binding protein [Odoribacter splanchnicus]
MAKAHGHWEELFRQKYPATLRPEDIHYEPDQPDQLAMINYTSGTTSASKGVMLSYRSMWSNLKYALDKMGYNPGERLVSILTMAHMYGLAFRTDLSLCQWYTRLFYLSKTPAPKIINEIFSAVRPNLIVAVPLIIENHQTPGTATTGKISYQAIPENPLSEPQIKAVDPG